ncbi:MAG: hypothetical protein CME06_09340 [Gemmatimonadetes bacterium]|nr:hypothetical protein [Gemmatimonadota bacterium]
MKRTLSFIALVFAVAVSGCTPPNKNFTGGKLDFKAQRYEKAKGQFAQALETEPQNPEIHLFMGRTLIEMKDFTGARGAFDQAIELGGEPYAGKVTAAVDPKYVELFKDGKTYADADKLDKAVESMSKAALLDPSRFDAHHALGVIQAKRDEFGAAEASLERAAEIKPEDRDVLFSLGVVQYNATKYEGAILTFKKILELSPGELSALENLARCYQLSEQYDEMIPVYKQIINADPSSSDAHYNYGVALVNAGRIEEAATELETVRELTPDDNEALLTLCRLYRDASMWDKAIAGLEIYVGAVPDDPAGYTEQARVYTAMADALAAEGSNAEANRLRTKALDALTIAGDKSGG